MASYAESYGLSTVSLRYFNIFGPRQPAGSPYSGVVPIFASRVMAGERPEVHGDGSQTRDFTYVGNAVLANLLAGRSEAPLIGQAVNIGSGARTSVADLARLVASSFDRSDLEPLFGPPRTGDVKDSCASIERARSLIGYEPVTGFEEGLRQTLSWWREQDAQAGLPGGKGTR
jgi:UDP-glucose 4-epimerase